MKAKSIIPKYYWTSVVIACKNRMSLGFLETSVLLYVSDIKTEVLQNKSKLLYLNRFHNKWHFNNQLLKAAHSKLRVFCFYISYKSIALSNKTARNVGKKTTTESQLNFFKHFFYSPIGSSGNMHCTTYKEYESVIFCI